MSNDVTRPAGAADSELTGEPAIWAALIASGVQMGAAFWLPLSDGQVAVINAVVLAAAGVWVAFKTRTPDNGGSIKAALLGLAQAFISLALAFGWDASAEQTATLMTFVGLAVAAFLRQTSVPNLPVGKGTHAGQDLPSL